MRRLIFVHGINNEDSTAAHIQNTWAASLKAAVGPRADDWWGDVDFRTAYYGKTLADETANWDKAQDAGARMSAGSPPEDFADGDISALYLPLQRGNDIDDATVAPELDPDDDPSLAAPMAAGGAVPTMDAAEAFGEIKKQTNIPPIRLD